MVSFLKMPTQRLGSCETTPAWKLPILTVTRSICAPNSIKPLKITHKAMNKILTHHKVDPQFLDLLMSFATGSKESEVGPGRMAMKHQSDGSYGSSSASRAMKRWANFKIRNAISTELCRGSSGRVRHSSDRGFPPFRSQRPRKSLDLSQS